MAPDPQVATAALIDALGAQTLAKAAAYTAGKHWLLLWDLAVTGVATWASVRCVYMVDESKLVSGIR